MWPEHFSPTFSRTGMTSDHVILLSWDGKGQHPVGFIPMRFWSHPLFAFICDISRRFRRVPDFQYSSNVFRCELHDGLLYGHRPICLALKMIQFFSDHWKWSRACLVCMCYIMLCCVVLWYVMLCCVVLSCRVVSCRVASVCLPACLPACLSVCLSVCLCVCLCVYVCYVMLSYVMSCNVMSWYGMVWYGLVWYGCM